MTRPGGGFGKLIVAIPHFLLLLARLVRDGRVPTADKAILAASVVYAISPLDLMPDFLPFIGQLDDLYLVALAIQRMLVSAGPDVIADNWTGPDEALVGLLDRVDSLASYLPGPVERTLAARVKDR